ncbi:FAD-binding oxidoreductase [Cryptosporangium phraense]|uniref:FAD-binding oxidoreductase n=1 Tax=Cryptosporangium phraense TaxID=2593070 RepID=A0A545ANB1_9ACTN|nr:FAD-binding oxidoreductase [Cryptosporangium phraense]TQS42225.1 FAD-binding oxidoreductase [Cryptosporangium phraense]
MITTDAVGTDLNRMVRGQVLTPGDSGWDVARRPWNLRVQQEVRAVVLASDAADVAATVRYAARNGLSVAAQPVGHGATTALRDTILLRTGALRTAEIDPVARTARVAAGAGWADVLGRAGAHGLTGLAGSSTGPSVVGFTLGGGLSWFGRKYGFAANAVRSAEVVDATGERYRIDAASDPELFWALRGGGGDFALVTELEFDLYPAPLLYGGRLLWPVERAAEVLEAYRETVAMAPEELSLWYTLLRFPAIPELPEFLRGRAMVAVDATYLGGLISGRELLAPLLKVPGTLLDTVGTLQVADLGSVAAEPLDPVPAMEYAALLPELTDDAADTLLGLAGPHSGSPLTSVQLRHLGGALARPTGTGGAVGHLEERFSLNAIGMPMGPGMAEQIETHHGLMAQALAPHASGRIFFTFLGSEESPVAAFPPDVLARLRAIKQERDPFGVVRSNHPVLS